MSYSILIKEKDKETIEILFSGNSFYENYWLRLSSKLNLSLITEFQYGVEIGHNELLELLLELSEVEKYLINQESKDKNDNKILERINYIRKEINKIDFNNIKIEEIFIG